jgi:hypothetical protein
LFSLIFFDWFALQTACPGKAQGQKSRFAAFFRIIQFFCQEEIKDAWRVAIDTPGGFAYTPRRIRFHVIAVARADSEATHNNRK